MWNEEGKAGSEGDSPDVVRPRAKWGSCWHASARGEALEIVVVVVVTEQLREEEKQGHWATRFGTPPNYGRRGRAARLLSWARLRGGGAEGAPRLSSFSHRRMLAQSRGKTTWEAPRDQPVREGARVKKVLPWAMTLNGSLGIDVRSVGESH